MELNYKQHLIKIFSDEDAQSPDTWEDEIVFLVYDHRDFYVARDGFNPRDIWANPTEFEAEYHIFVVYAYIHSGVALSLNTGTYPFNDRWDVSSTGYTLVSKQYVPDREKAVEIAQGLIEEWNQYLSGDVHGYEIYFQDEPVDSCGGYYGDSDCALEAAKEQVDFFVKNNPEKYAVQLKLEL